MLQAKFNEYLETFNNECKEIDALINSGAVTHIQYTRLVEKAVADFTQAIEKL